MLRSVPDWYIGCSLPFIAAGCGVDAGRATTGDGPACSGGGRIIGAAGSGPGLCPTGPDVEWVDQDRLATTGRPPIKRVPARARGTITFHRRGVERSFSKVGSTIG
jgi:hypothetical protein